MNHDEILDKLKKDVRSLLMSSKTGLEPEQLKHDYMATLGLPMPLKLLGFRHVMDMVKEMPDIVDVKFRPDGSQYLRAVGDESTDNIEELLVNQRMPKIEKKTKKGQHYFSPRHYQALHPVVLPRRGRAPPPLPAHLRAQIRVMLSQGPLRLSDLESTYLSSFGIPLHVHQYGFFSTGEMLEAAADMVAVQQTRFGSVLSLREHMIPRPLFAQSSPARRALIKRGPPRANRPQIRPSNAYIVPIVPPTASPAKQSPVIQPCPEKVVAPVPKTSTPVSSKPEVADRDQREDGSLVHQESQLFLKSVLKLEEELRQQIVENGVAGTISQDLKDKLRKVNQPALKVVVCQKTGGLSVHDLPTEYKRLFGEDLPLTQSGFTSVTELVAAMNDLFCLKLVTANRRHHWIISDIQDVETTQQEREIFSDGVELPVKSYYFSCEESSWERQPERQDNEDEDDEDEDTEDEHDVMSDDEVEELKPSHLSRTNILMAETRRVMQLHCGPSLPLDAMQNQRLRPPVPHAARELVEIVVEKVESPGHFYIRFSGSEEARALEDMMFEMRRCYSSPKVSEQYRLPQQFVRRGQVCCVSPRGIWLYRVVIHQILSPTEVEVYYVDFGDVTVVETTNLKFLKSCYSFLSAQAVPSSLAGITPNTGSWTAEATASFQSLCFERTLVGALDHYTGEVLHLYLCDTCTAEDIYIHKVLLSQGHGRACSVAASSALCAQVTPVSLYLGKGMVDLPEVDLEKISPPKAADQSVGGTEEDQDELPGLEFIEGVVFAPHSQGNEDNPFGALLSDNSLVLSTSTLQSPLVTPTTSTLSCFAPPDLILTQSTQTSC